MKLTPEQVSNMDQNHATIDEFLNEARADITKGLAALGIKTEAIAQIESHVAANLEVSCAVMAAQSETWTQLQMLSLLLARVLVLQEIERPYR